MSAANDPLQPLLAAIAKGQGAPVYLVVGEAFLARQAATQLVDALVPKGMQALNVTLMDAPGPVEVARDLATVPMFPSRKVVWARDPEFLLPKKGRGDALAKAREAWGAGRRRDAARRVLGVAARAGWSAAQLDPTSPDAVGREAWKSELEIELADVDLAFLAEVSRFCADEGLRAPEGDAGALEALVAAGFPKDHHLVLEASAADARIGLYKKLAAAGALVPCKVPTSGMAGKKLELGAHITGLLRPLNKRMSPPAVKLLEALCGGNMRHLSNEVEKLALFVGPRQTIEADDVEALVHRSRDLEFELNNAVQARDLNAAIELLGFALGAAREPPLKILGSLAATIRRLLELKEYSARMSLPAKLDYRAFEAQVMPALRDDAKATGRKLPHAYVAFLSWQAQARFSKAELRALLLACGDCDLALKTSASPQVSLERVLLGVRTTAPNPRTAR